MRDAYRAKLNAMTEAGAGLRAALSMAGRLFPALPRRAGGGLSPPAAGVPTRPEPRRGKSRERLAPGPGCESGFSAPRTGQPAGADTLIDSQRPGGDMRPNPSITPNDVPASRNSARRASGRPRTPGPERASAGNGPRRASAARALAALALALGLLFGGAAPGSAQTDRILVSNAGQTTTVSNSAARNSAQAFTTGSNAAGYSLARITLHGRGFRASDDNTVTLHEGTRTGAKVADFIAAAAGTTLTLTPKAGTHLKGGTTYFVVTGSDLGPSVNWYITNSPDEDGSSAYGWGIADDTEARDLVSHDTWHTNAESRKFTVTGFGNPHGTLLTSVLNENMRQDALVGYHFGNRYEQAQGFRTGGNADGYALYSVSARFLYMTQGAWLRVSIHASAAGRPGRKLFELTNPSGLHGFARHTFSAPANTVLQPNTDYFVVFEEISGANSTRVYRVMATDSPAQTGDHGFDVAYGGYYIHESRGNWASASSTSSTMAIAILGDALPLQSLLSEPALRISGPAGVVAEGDNSDFTVTLSPASSQEVTVNFVAWWAPDGDRPAATVTTDFIVTSADTGFDARTGSLTFAPGETRKTIMVTTVNDIIQEHDEEFFVTLSGAVGAEIADARASAVISDAGMDAEPIIFVDRHSHVVDEGDVAGFTVELSPASGKTVTVDFRTTLDGTASTNDLAMRSGTLTFAPGETLKVVHVATVRDALDEEDETFGFRALNPVNATMGADDRSAVFIRNAAPPAGDGPYIVGVVISSDAGADGTYAIGDEVEVTFTFNEYIAFIEDDGSPDLVLDFAGAERIARPWRYGGNGAIVRTNSNRSMHFRYTVQEGDEDLDGIAVAENALRLNGSEIIKLRASDRARKRVANVQHHRVFADTRHKVDGVRPRMVSGETAADGRRVRVRFSEPFREVRSIGFEVRGLYPRFSSTDSLRPIWKAFYEGRDGIDLGIPYAPARPGRDMSVSLRVATIADDAGNTNAQHEISVADGVAVRRLGVAAMAITSDPGPDGYTAGEHIEVTVTFGSAMWVYNAFGGPPWLRFNLGQRLGNWRQAHYVRGAGTHELVFRYTVRASDGTLGDRVWIPHDSIRVRGAEIKDILGDRADLAHGAVPGPWTGTRPPSLTGAYNNMAERHASPFTFEVAFSEAVAIARQDMIDHVFDITNGAVTEAVRLDNEHDEADGLQANREWRITVDSHSDEAVTVVLPETTDCDADGAVCTPDGRKLTGELRAVVPGPATPTGLTAAFDDVPASHGGDEFTFRLRYSEAFKLRWLTMFESALSVENGRVVAARRIDNPHDENDGHRPNREWEITVAPDADAGDVTVTLPETTDCDADGAVCNGEEMLSAAVTATVPRQSVTPLTAAFAGAPGAHGGAAAFTVEVHYSEALKLRWRSMLEDVLSVSNGRVVAAKRLDNPHNERGGLEANRSWRVTVEPDDGASDVTVTLPETTDCEADGAVCAGDGRMLSEDVAVTVPRTAAAPLSARFAGAPESHCCFPLYLVGAPYDLTGLFRRRFSWDDGAIRDTSDRGEVVFLMNDCCRSGGDVVARVALAPQSLPPA